MRRTFVYLAAWALLGLVTGSARAEESSGPPEGFTPLFNDKDLRGWKVYGGNDKAWGVENGILFTSGRGGGWLMTEKEYGDFELLLEFRLPKNGNSGVALRSPLQGNPAYTGMEIQILDDPTYKNLQVWQHTGSIYGVVPSKKQPNKPIGEWNKYRIVCKGRQVSVELNGEKIVDANLDDHVKQHAKAHPGILREKGHIGLQEHGGRVEFRNIYVKELK